MSSGLEFLEVEWAPGQWYWIRQSDFCTVSAWDWREEDPTVVGPFASQEDLQESYRAHESNTGGASYIFADEKPHTSEVLARCIANAVTPAKRYRSYY
jgi:hypothetical protein